MVFILKMVLSFIKGVRIINTEDLVLPGEHNLENILAAVLACILAGVPIKAIIDSLTTFSGIEHRLQYVGTNRTNKYYNDSKATNTLATQFALNSFNQPIIWLCGGLIEGMNLTSSFLIWKMFARWLYSDKRKLSLLN